MSGRRRFATPLLGRLLRRHVGGARRPGRAAPGAGFPFLCGGAGPGRVRRQEMAAVLQQQLPGPPAPQCRAQAA